MKGFAGPPAAKERPMDTDQTRCSDAIDRNARRGDGRELLAQLYRRHEAARRLPPPSHSGRRDPLSPRGLTAGCEIDVVNE